jgi:hypothetical protein
MSVTNLQDANVAFFKLTSAGTAYNLELPFNPDCLEWWNYTAYGVASLDAAIGKQGIWFAGFPSGSALAMLNIVDNGVAALGNLVVEGANGITVLSDGSGFADNHKVPTAITAAMPPVVTSNGHGLINGQYVRATDFVTSPVAKATGMEQLNNKLFLVGLVTANTFALFDSQTGIAVDATAYTAFVNNGVAQFTLAGESLNTQNAPPVYRVTLGTAVMGAAGNVIYLRAMKGNDYINLGQVV